jgi:hypothetical protein
MTLHEVRRSEDDADHVELTFPKGLGPNLLVTVITIGLLAFITMGLRVYTRVTKRTWGLEDWIMSIGCVKTLFIAKIECSELTPIRYHS